MGLLACGELILVDSSGAFDATNANRGVSVETANDEDAFLGIDYADDGSGGRTVTLAGNDSCSFLGCYYIETVILRLKDDPADTQLNDPTVEFETSVTISSPPSERTSDRIGRKRARGSPWRLPLSN